MQKEQITTKGTHSQPRVFCKDGSSDIRREEQGCFCIPERSLRLINNAFEVPLWLLTIVQRQIFLKFKILISFSLGILKLGNILSCKKEVI